MRVYYFFLSQSFSGRRPEVQWRGSQQKDRSHSGRSDGIAQLHTVQGRRRAHPHQTDGQLGLHQRRALGERY